MEKLTKENLNITIEGIRISLALVGITIIVSLFPVILSLFNTPSLLRHATYAVIFFSLFAAIIIVYLSIRIKNPYKKFDDKKDSVENNKEEDLRPHFVKTINYSENEPWRTDFALGQKGSDSHGHIALSGSQMWYGRDESGREIVKDGKVVSNNNLK